MALQRKIRRNNAERIVTIGEAFKRFKDEKKADNITAATLKNYKQSFGYFKAFCSFNDDTDIKQINRDLVIQWKRSMCDNPSLSPSATNHYIRDCRAFFYWCMGDDRKFLEPFKVEEIKGQKTKPKTYSDDDMKRLLRKPRNQEDYDFTEWRNWAVASLAYDMGARASTLINIQLKDINFQRRTVYLSHTKNQNVTIANFSTACAKSLKQYISLYLDSADDEAYLFPNVAGEQLTYNALAHSFTKYCKDRGAVQHSLHGLRHSFATQFAENTNGDTVKLQKALGHSSIDMSMKYVDLAKVNMGNYDDISPLNKTSEKRGRPKRKY